MNLIITKMKFLSVPIIPIIIILSLLIFQIFLLVNLVKSRKKDYNAKKKAKKLVNIYIYLIIVLEIFLLIIKMDLGRSGTRSSLYILNLLISLLIISMEKKGKRRYIFKLVASIIFLFMAIIGINIIGNYLGL